MGIDVTLLRDQCAHTLERTDLPELGERIEGKVRDSYVRGRQRTIVVTDRVSCFDVVVGTIPLKGRISAWSSRRAGDATAVKLTSSSQPRSPA